VWDITSVIQLMECTRAQPKIMVSFKVANDGTSVYVALCLAFMPFSFFLKQVQKSFYFEAFKLEMCSTSESSLHTEIHDGSLI
jgi:hypothetical protein